VQPFRRHPRYLLVALLVFVAQITLAFAHIHVHSRELSRPPPLRVIQHPFQPMVAQIVVSARPFTSLQRSSPRPAGASSFPSKHTAAISLIVLRHWGHLARRLRGQASDAVSVPPSPIYVPRSPPLGELTMRPPLLRILLVASSASVHFKPDPIGDLVFNGVASDVLRSSF